MGVRERNEEEDIQRSQENLFVCLFLIRTQLFCLDLRLNERKQIHQMGRLYPFLKIGLFSLNKEEKAA